MQPSVTFRRRIDERGQLDAGVSLFQGRKSLLRRGSILRWFVGLPCFAGLVGSCGRRVLAAYGLLAGGNRVHRTSTRDAKSKIVEETSDLAVRPRLRVLCFDEQPVLLLGIAMHTDEVPIALQPLAVQREREVAFLQTGARIAL